MNVYLLIFISVSFGCCFGYILSSLIHNSKYPVNVILPQTDNDDSLEAFIRRRYKEDFTFAMRGAIEEGAIRLVELEE